jgi:hypothetical protein
VARQVRRVLRQAGLLADRPEPGQTTLFTSGDAGQLAAVAGRLLDELFPVQAVAWGDDGLEPIRKNNLT